MKLLLSNKNAIGAVLLLIGILLLDYFVPLGVAVGALYVTVVLFYIKESKQNILILSGVITILITILFFLGNEADTSWKVIANRAISILAVWITSFIAIQYKKIDEEFNKNAKLLQRKNKELEEFSYVASHDLQEPVRVLTNMTQILPRSMDNDDQRNEIVKHINLSSKRLNQMINGLLEYNRIGRNTKIEQIDLSILVHDIIKTTKTDFIFKSDKLPKISGYKNELYLLFYHLIDNSIKFRQDNEALKIKLSINEVEDIYQFTYTDNAKGIHKDFQQKAFTLFQCYHPRGQYQGIGIGLSLCKKTIQLHKGNIHFKSDGENGTKFTFSIGKI